MNAFTINLHEAFWLLAYAGTAVAGLCTLGGFFSRRWWIFDICSHFRVQYVLFFIVMVVIFFLGGQFLGGLAAAAFGLVNLALVWPEIRSRPQPPAPEKVYRLFLSNVLMENRSFHRTLQVIESIEPDLVVLLEVDQTWLMALNALENSYPYCLRHSHEDHFGVAIYSKVPLQDPQTLFIGNPEGATLLARLALDDQLLALLATHPWPPKGAHKTKLRDLQMEEIAHQVKNLSTPAILCGDLNLSPWSGTFQQILAVSRLRDSRSGFGLQASWPVNRLPLRITIDQILVSETIQVHRRFLAPNIGSDHFPVVMEFSIKNTTADDRRQTVERVMGDE